MPRTRIPVIVVAGFLGSGKTTLLNHLLTHSGGARIGVIVNDFGSINIDAMSVAGQVDSMITLGNGCLCCAVDAEDIDGMLGRLTQPKAGIDVIVIEASGLADPRGMVRLVLASTDEHITYGGLVQVVDAAEFGGTREHHPEFAGQLRFSDLVVLNKSDRVDADTLARTLDTVRELAEGAPVMATTHGRVDPAFLFDRQRVTARRDQARQLSFDDLLREEDHSEHAHTAYDSIEFTSVQPMHPVRLLDFLKQRPTGLYRVKGFAHFGVPGYGDRFTVHTVGAYLRFQRSSWRRGEEPMTQLVAIGAGVDGAALKERLAMCVAAAEETVAERDMLWLFRYMAEDGTS